ncbi:MAG: arginine--tRNA ligase [Patescibacteria group bacterium]
MEKENDLVLNGIMLREEIHKVLEEAVEGPTPFKIAVSEPTASGENRGHYSTNVAFSFSKIRKQPPLLIAEDIVKKIKNKASKLIAKAEAVAPGFINIWLAPDAFYKELEVILKEKKNYGAGKKTKEKIQVEFISANPTGPLTLANGRGGFLGDVIANTLAFSGIEVEREYYVNDMGRQVLILGKSIIASQGHTPEEDEFYKGAYIAEWSAGHKKFVSENKNNPEAVGEVAAQDFLGMIKTTIEKKSGIRFDRYTSEKNDIRAKGFVEKTLAAFKKAGAAYERDGAVWLKTSEHGDDKDRVLVTSEKEPTYFLADAGHYLETKDRGFTGKINILGPDHYGYVARIQAAAKLLGLANSRVLITQAVRLIKNGEEARMSKRKGEFITFEELVNDVGADVARFFFLMIAPETHMDFDLGLAKEHSSKNPVFYVQYAYVRARGIKEKAVEIKRRPDWNLLHTEEDMRLMLALAEFPEIVADTANDIQAHRIPRYAIKLARAFQIFYERERVAGEEEKLAQARLGLVCATIQVFENLFRVLGISAPEKM